jgi:hypothetical protein
MTTNPQRRFVVAPGLPFGAVDIPAGRDDIAVPVLVRETSVDSASLNLARVS